MNAIEENEFSRAWAEEASALPVPASILCISAHWETSGTCVSASPLPPMIYDFYGFPPELFRVHYPAPGSPDLARRVQECVSSTSVVLDAQRGLDHGAWSVLCRMFPGADIPVVQLSLDRALGPAQHYALGAELKGLRDEGVLIVGSGNIVHNLGAMEWRDTAHDWAVAFDNKMRELILAGDHESILHYEQWAGARLSVPTAEHFLPLLYILALGEPGESLRFFADRVTLGSLSMRSLVIGGGDRT